MAGDDVLLESKTMRAALAGRIEALDRVKTLETLPNGLHLLTEDVADYFGVPARTIHSVVFDYREELESHGYQVLTGKRLTAFKTTSGIQSRARQLALFNRRTVLYAAMLLRDSEIARQVRARLLDLEASARFLPVDNPLRDLPRSADVSAVELTANALRGVLGATVIPLLNALMEQANGQELTLAELAYRLGQIEQVVLDEDVYRTERRRLRLLRPLEEEQSEDADWDADEDAYEDVEEDLEEDGDGRGGGD
ncbi:hypothetical protein ABIA33_004152 [Streptacidiphilus sp. MAP12-16]|uniref:restriction endonuclease n=1 Tax=Streptacidiphilus sp. MAP12-16 TaxID=3156300 RepID=UPI00351111DF